MSTDTFWAADARSFLLAEGPDAQSYLQSQVSQDLNGLAVGGSVYALVLEPAGKVIAVMRITRTGDESFVLDTDPAAADAVLTRLTRFKIRVRADLTALDWSCIAVRGAAAGTSATDGTISAADTSATDDTAAVEGTTAVAGISAADGTWAVRAWRGDAVDLIGPSPEPPPGVAAGTAEQLLAARIDAGWPVAGVDYAPGESIPAALGVTAEAVSFTKGCYPGQELVERMDSRGARAPKSLHVVDVPAGTRVGDEVDAGGSAVVVTSVAGTRAIALVRR